MHSFMGHELLICFNMVVIPEQPYYQQISRIITTTVEARVSTVTVQKRALSNFWAKFLPRTRRFRRLPHLSNLRRSLRQQTLTSDPDCSPPESSTSMQSSSSLSEEGVGSVLLSPEPLRHLLLLILCVRCTLQTREL